MIRNIEKFKQFPYFKTVNLYKTNKPESNQMQLRYFFTCVINEMQNSKRSSFEIYKVVL